MVLSMKRAAIIVLAIATLVLIVSPSASLFASSSYSIPTKHGATGPSVAPSAATDTRGPSNSPGGGTGGGDEGDADGLSGMKIKPVNQSSFAGTTDRIAITLTMWWRYMLLIR
jgi:hypothetical protein